MFRGLWVVGRVKERVGRLGWLCLIGTGNWDNLCDTV